MAKAEKLFAKCVELTQCVDIAREGREPICLTNLARIYKKQASARVRGGAAPLRHSAPPLSPVTLLRRSAPTILLRRSVPPLCSLPPGRPAGGLLSNRYDAAPTSPLTPAHHLHRYGNSCRPAHRPSRVSWSAPKSC